MTDFLERLKNDQKTQLEAYDKGMADARIDYKDASERAVTHGRSFAHKEIDLAIENCHMSAHHCYWAGYESALNEMLDDYQNEE